MAARRVSLIERGVPAQRLLLTVVFTPNRERHLVLVLRTSDADLVLDNLELRILDWRETGYRVVATQNSSDERNWLLVKPSGQPNPALDVARHRIKRQAKAGLGSSRYVHTQPALPLFPPA